MPETAILIAALVALGAIVLWPLRASWTGPPDADDDREAAALRHRAALEALRDVEADRRGGLLDDDAYATELAEAERRAVAARAPEGPAAGTAESAPAPRSAPRRLAFVAAAAIGVGIAGASLVPGTGVANSTVTNRALAEAEVREGIRQERIGDLLEALADDGKNPDTLSELADLYLAGTSREDLAVAATLLRGLIDVEPYRADAYERIIAAYLRAGDHANARAALEAYDEVPSADPVEIAFFDGIIALRGERDAAEAVKAFDRFLELAPDDPRAEMIEGLREEASAG